MSAAASPLPRKLSPSRGLAEKLAESRPAPPAAEVLPTVSVTLERLVVKGGVPRAGPRDNPAMEQRVSFLYVFCSFVPLAVLGMLLEAAVFVFSAVLQVWWRQSWNIWWGRVGGKHRICRVLVNFAALIVIVITLPSVTP